MEIATKTKWNIDAAHSEISFRVRHMMISMVTGHFENFNALAETQNNSFDDAKFVFIAQVESINSKNKDRDEHLKSDDFFDVRVYPEIKYVSKDFDGKILIGDLTIKDITKEISLSVDFNGIVIDPFGQTKAGFEITGNINRKDFDLTWSAVTEAGGIIVGDTVKLIIDLQFIKE